MQFSLLVLCSSRSYTIPSRLWQFTAVNPNWGTRARGRIPAEKNCQEAADPLTWMLSYILYSAAATLPSLKTPNTHKKKQIGTCTWKILCVEFEERNQLIFVLGQLSPCCHLATMVWQRSRWTSLWGIKFFFLSCFLMVMGHNWRISMMTACHRWAFLRNQAMSPPP